MKKWKILASKIAFDNKFFTIEEDKCQKSNDEIVDKYYTIKRPDAAIIAAFTEKKELILIRQYRHPVKAIDIELPAGYIEPTESNMLEAAKREFLEETGFQAEKMIKLQKCHASAGLMANNLHFFLGLNAQKIQEPTLDANEEIEVVITPWQEVSKLIQAEKIRDMASVLGIILAEKYLEQQNNE